MSKFRNPPPTPPMSYVPRPTPSPTNPPAPQEEPPTFTIRVYLDNGLVYEYDTTSAHRAREHAAAIITGGYRHNDGQGAFEHYPPHRISKVKIIGIVPTDYPDRVLGT